MRPAEDIKTLIRNLTDRTSAEMDERVLGDVLRVLAESEKTTSAFTKPNIRRIIMKGPITKLAAAAAIIVIAALLITFLEKSATPAYALDQTIKANHTVRYLHIRQINPSYDEPILIWAEFDDTGQVANWRLHLPEWSEGDDGAKVAIWKDNKAQVWLKKKNVLMTIKEKAIAAMIYKAVEKNDPKMAIERLYKLEAEGKVKVGIAEPDDKAQPIVVTATSLPESSTPNQRLVLFVDQASKLVLSIEVYELENGKYEKKNIVEFYGYNQPIDAKMFTLDDEVPADVMRIDQATQEVGLAQGDLIDEEIAIEVVRQFFEALIARDYAKAGKLLEGMPGDRMQQEFGHIKFLRIISIGPAGPHPIPATKGLFVPCTVEIEKDGKISEWKLDRLGVRQVYNQPGRWTIFGGI